MLACARIGATHNVVFGGFASKELSVRIDASKPRVIIAGSNGALPGKIVPFQPIIDAAVGMSQHKPLYTIYKNRSPEVFNDMYIYLRVGKHAKSPCYRKHPVNFVSHKSQVTAFPKLLLPNHIIEVVMKS